MSHVEPAAAGVDQVGEGTVVPHDNGVSGTGGDVATTEAQVAVAVSTSGDERRGDYGDDAENEEEEEAATVQGSKEGTDELLRKVVCSEEAAYKLYCDYGHRMGFSIRKGKQSYFTGTKRIRTKDYFCSKEGLKEGEKLTDANFNDPHTRTNCRAMVRFRVNDQGEWKVIRLVSDHNHNLARPEERHLLRSARSLIAGRSSSVEVMLYGGYQVQGGAPQLPTGSTSATNNVENQKQDLLLGYGAATKTLTIGTGDVQSLVSHLKSRANEDESYILKRWTKDAKKWVFNPKQYESSYQECMNDEAAYCNYVMRYAYDLVTKSQGQDALRKALWETLESDLSAKDEQDTSLFFQDAFRTSLKLYIYRDETDACQRYRLDDAAMPAFILAGYIVELAFCPYSIRLLTMYSIIPDKQLCIRNSEGQD
uniref:FAR1 domain-containing protein n=1 Tax=Zea mays TaxID=4577 RepID=A0A804PIP6_MAIZE